MTEINYWLMKSEPEAYSINDLQKEEVTIWDGIRNYQARNYMRSMAINDRAFFYHSNCKTPCIVGLMEVTRTKLTDPTQFEPSSKYYDAKSPIEKPRWDCAELRYLGKFTNNLSLKELKMLYNEEDLKILSKGNRISIIPVPEKIATDLILRLGDLI